MATGKKYLSFIDLAPFDKAWKHLRLNDDDHAALENLILESPKSHPVVAGTMGLRKIRFAARSWDTGKRGSLRVAYVVFEVHRTIVLVTAYPKNVKDNLTATDRRAINDLITRIDRALTQFDAKRRK